jgi:hypothetical protein
MAVTFVWLPIAKNVVYTRLVYTHSCENQGEKKPSKITVLQKVHTFDENRIAVSNITIGRVESKRNIRTTNER